MKITKTTYDNCQLGDTVIFYSNKIIIGTKISNGLFNFKSSNDDMIITGKYHAVYKLQNDSAWTIIKNKFKELLHARK